MTGLGSGTHVPALHGPAFALGPGLLDIPGPMDGRLKIDDDLGSTSPPNSGWTSIKFYWDQTNNSGSPDETLTRSSATYTASGGVGAAYATWEWSVSGTTPYNTWFGSTSGGARTHFVEMI